MSEVVQRYVDMILAPLPWPWDFLVLLGGAVLAAFLLVRGLSTLIAPFLPPEPRLLCLQCGLEGVRAEFMEHDPDWWNDQDESVECPRCGMDVAFP